MFVKYKIFLSKIIVLQLWIQKISCDCGPAGLSDRFYIRGGNINGEGRSINPENSVVSYGDLLCHNEIYYDTTRTCTKGKWTGRQPKCGNS